MSGRRFVWGFSCLLLLAAVMIYRPIRTWVDQVMIARNLHPHLKVHEISLHRSPHLRDHTIVQAKHFDWGATEDRRCFGISAENAWIAVEDEPLFHRRVSIPKAVLQNSRLFMDDLAKEDRFTFVKSVATQDRDLETTDRTWWNSLGTGRENWNWNELRKHLDGLLKTNEFTIECTKRIEDWASQGAQLAESARRLSKPLNDWNNPLRDPSEIDGRLASLEQIGKQEDELRSELQSLEKYIVARLQTIGNILEEQRARFELPDPEQQGLVQAETVDIRAVANQLLTHAGNQTTTKFGVFAEVADRFCRAAVRDSRPSYDRDLRRSGMELLSVQHLTAKGMFRCDPIMVPFELSSHGRQIQADQLTISNEAQLHFQFDDATMRILASVNSNLNNGSSNELRIEFIPQGSRQSPKTVGECPAVKVQSPQWSIVTSGAGISGFLDLDGRLLPALIAEYPLIAEAAQRELGTERELGELGTELQESDDKPIRLSCCGSWQSMQWSVETEDLPFWLIKEVMIEHQRQRLLENEHRMAMVEQYIGQQMEQVESSLNSVIEIAKGHAKQHSDTIMAARHLLQSELSKVEQIDFARQPQDDLKR